MTIIDKAKEFYQDNEDLVWTCAYGVFMLGCGVCIGKAIGYTKGFNAGTKYGSVSTETVVAAMEPEAYARICDNVQKAIDVLK